MIKEILKIYEKMIENIETNSLRVRNQNNKKLACYFYNQGKQYDGKLMIIGRAGNGCNEENSWKQGDSR